nr:hypothetical protein [Pandoravirus belohorizontensis]
MHFYQKKKETQKRHIAKAPGSARRRLCAPIFFVTFFLSTARKTAIGGLHHYTAPFWGSGSTTEVIETNQSDTPYLRDGVGKKNTEKKHNTTPHTCQTADNTVRF